jgi:phage tail-like protein
MDQQPAFYFRVQFPDDPNITDTSFQDISGIATEIQTEAIEEGGLNSYTHIVPKSAKHGNLVLKRGIAGIDSKLVDWCKTTLEGDLGTLISPKTIQVALLNPAGQVAFMWQFNKAWPVKWSVDNFNSTKNEIVVESMEFAYSYAIRVK